jgi:hypothetical protein
LGDLDEKMKMDLEKRLREEKRCKEIDGVVRPLFDFLNGASGEDMERFVKIAHGTMHKTLQQNFMKMIVMWIKVNSTTNYMDLRNEATVNLCKAIVKNVDEADLYLPLI